MSICFGFGRTVKTFYPKSQQQSVRRLSTLKKHLLISISSRSTSSTSSCSSSSSSNIIHSDSCFSFSRSASTSSPSSAVSSHYADVNGVKIHYEKTGFGKHVLLLMPGALGSSSTDFGPQLEKLNKDKYTVIAWDPRGYGRSIPPERDWPLEYLQRDAEDAVSLMKTLHHHHFSVLGWSDGGITGLILTGRYPELVRSLVIWGANAYILPSDMPIFEQIVDVSKWSTRMREPFVKVYGLDYFQKQWKNWVHAYSQYLHQRKGNICMEETKAIRCPTLIVHGQKDALVVQEHADYLHATIPNSILVNWPEAKHNLHLRYADDFNSLIDQFLDKVP